MATQATDMGNAPDPLRSNVRPIRAGARGQAARVDAAELGLDDGKYSPDEFYCASTNEHDHSETIQLKLPKHVKAQLNELIRTGRVPAYRSPNDALRDGLVHRLHFLQHEYELPPALEFWVTTERTRARLETIQAEMAAQRQLVDHVREVVETAVQEQDRAMLEVIVTQVGDFIDVAREPHRGAVIEHLRVGYRSLGMNDAALAELAAVETGDGFDVSIEAETGQGDA